MQVHFDLFLKRQFFLFFSLFIDTLFVSGGGKGQSYPFGIMGMANKNVCLQKGEQVKFQVCTIPQTGQKMACNVVPPRLALVECVKDQVVVMHQLNTTGFLLKEKGI